MYRHLEENLKSTTSTRSRRKRNYNLSTPAVDYDQTMMSTDLDIMAQVRRGLMNEVKYKHVGNLTSEKIEEIKKNYIPEHLRNLDNLREKLQRQKKKIELLSRNPLFSASYHLLAFNNKSKTSLRRSLEEALPGAYRFQAHRRNHLKT